MQMGKIIKWISKKKGKNGADWIHIVHDTVK
jgi:hypothetical protein